MKKTIIPIFLLINITCFAGDEKKCPPQSPAIDTLLNYILALPLQSYIGKPVDSLFSILPANYTDRSFMPMGIGYSRGVFQSYGTSGANTISVQIFIDTFQFMTFPNRTKTTTWNMNLAKQETISYIRVLKNNVCMYGCNNPDYY